MRALVIFAALLVLTACGSPDAPATAPPPVIVTGAPQPAPATKKLDLSGMCPAISKWTDADMAAVVNAAPEGSPTLRALLEWYRLRKDAEACQNAARGH